MKLGLLGQVHSMRHDLTHKVGDALSAFGKVAHAFAQGFGFTGGEVRSALEKVGELGQKFRGFFADRHPGFFGSAGSPPLARDFHRCFCGVADRTVDTSRFRPAIFAGLQRGRETFSPSMFRSATFAQADAGLTRGFKPGFSFAQASPRPESAPRPTHAAPRHADAPTPRTSPPPSAGVPPRASTPPPRPNVAPPANAPAPRPHAAPRANAPAPRPSAAPAASGPPPASAAPPRPQSKEEGHLAHMVELGLDPSKLGRLDDPEVWSVFNKCVRTGLLKFHPDKNRGATNEELPKLHAELQRFTELKGYLGDMRAKLLAQRGPATS